MTWETNSGETRTMQIWQLRVKRALDVAGAAILLVAASPLWAVLAWLIPHKLGPGGVFFRQVRPGHREAPFELVKFRTMLEAFDAEGNALDEGQRLTRFGWVLRKYSIDELPELWNVLRGEMSLVGPRPLLTEYLQNYPRQFRRRHDVKPGITGWAQVNGRHHVTFRERLELDLWYVDHWSVLLDLKIMWRTVWTVLRARDVAPPDQPIEAVDDLNLHVAVKPRRRTGSA
jgi:lipopolysaccharide/colanic/teichoic acid biosynthesis glycosyltransferase